MLSVHLENGAVTVRDIAKPERPPGYALIRTLVAGICNTDLELQLGELPGEIRRGNSVR